MEKYLRPLRMPEMLVLSQFQDVFGHPKSLYGFFPSTVLPPLKTNEDHPKIDGIIEDDSFPFKIVPFFGDIPSFSGGIVMAFSRVSEELVGGFNLSEKY